MAVVVKTVQRDPILGVSVNSPPILEPILVVGLNGMFTGTDFLTHGHIGKVHPELCKEN